MFSMMQLSILQRYIESAKKCEYGQKKLSKISLNIIASMTVIGDTPKYTTWKFNALYLALCDTCKQLVHSIIKRSVSVTMHTEIVSTEAHIN